jgi:hypothetical protein
MKLRFEHDFQQKIMQQVFEDPYIIDSGQAVQKWRSAWMQELKSWHSPYKLIVDCSKLTVIASPETTDALTRMIRFFEGLFLKSMIGFGFDATKGHDNLGFRVVSTFEEAQKEAGVRGLRSATAPADFRDSIQFQNHFAQHVIEMSFSDDALIDSKEKINAIKSKLTNTLMQWHSKWSLLIDCSHLKFDATLAPEWTKLEAYFKGFFMKAVVGYSPQDAERENYPFKTFRARHAAVAQLENEGHFMGNEAQCRTKSKD